jgi:catalase
VFTADSGAALAPDLVAAMRMHKVWARADKVSASAVPPAA